jgi:Spy/CpxP family protein refolding chaperone
MLEAVRITRMTEALELNDKQIAEFFPRLKQMDDGIREVTRARSKLVKELDSLLDRGSKEAELRAKLSQIDNLEIERLNKMKNFKLEMDRILTVKQQAKMVVFNHNFDEEIREMVREIRQKRMKHFRN